jgi:hypothetical protein
MVQSLQSLKRGQNGEKGGEIYTILNVLGIYRRIECRRSIVVGFIDADCGICVFPNIEGSTNKKFGRVGREREQSNVGGSNCFKT